MAKKPKKSKADKADKADVDAPMKKGGLVGQLVLCITLGAASFGTAIFLPGQDASTEYVEAKDDHSVVSTQPDYDFDRPVSFVALSPFTLTLQKGESLLKIGITLEVDPDSVDMIDPDDPQIRDAFTGYLRAIELEKINDTAFMAQIRSQLLQRARLIHDPDMVLGILITDFLVR